MVLAAVTEAPVTGVSSVVGAALLDTVTDVGGALGATLGGALGGADELGGGAWNADGITA
jgi:hypothetical protein